MTDPRWLSAPQQRDWRAYVEGSIRLNDVLDRDLKAKHGLTMAEYEILVRLSDAPDHRLRMAQLADEASQSRSRLSHTVSRLECKGLVTRGTCGADKRGVNAELTEEGSPSCRRPRSIMSPRCVSSSSTWSTPPTWPPSAGRSRPSPSRSPRRADQLIPVQKPNENSDRNVQPHISPTPYNRMNPVIL